MVGRKRIFARRQKNGQPSRRAADAKARDLAARQGETQIVLAQEHRLGNADQRCESPLGRFCIRYALSDEVFRAGDQYAAIVRRWRAAKGIPTDERVGGGGNGDGPSDETIREWGAQRLRCDRAMSEASHDGYLAVVAMILYRAELSAEQWFSVTLALTALAQELGTLHGSHPFA